MNIAKLYVEVEANASKFHNNMTGVRNDINRTSSEASKMGSIINTAIGTATGMIATQAIGKITETWQWIKKTGEEFNSLKENSQLAFETMLGSGEKATAFLASLQKFAEKTPFELPGLIDASQKMIAFGFASEQVLPTLTAIGDAVSGLGGSPEKLQRVITAIGQIKAKGKVQAQEMLQLAEAGIPAWEMLAKAIGTSIPEAMKLSEKGAIDANTAINALVSGMNDKFGGLMEKQSKSFSGLRSTFNDLMRDVAAKITKPWFDNAKKGLERMIAIMQSDAFKAFLDKAVKGSEKLANIVAKVKGTLFELAGKGFNLIANLFGGKEDANNTLSLFDTLPKKIQSILGFIKPIGSFVYDLLNKGFKAFTGIFDGFYRSFNKISNERFYFFGDMSLDEFQKGIKSIFQDISSGGKNLNYWLYTAPKAFQVITRLILAAKNIFTYFSGEGLQTTLKKLGSILSGLGSTLAKLVRPFKDALGGLFQQLSTMKNMGFADIFKAVISSIVAALKGFISTVKEEFWPSIKNGLVWLWQSLWSFISSINWSDVWQGIVDGFNAIVDFIASIDWGKVWANVWAGLTAVGSFLKDTVWPVLTDFFDWLLSWFLDTEKRNKLYSAITATWNFIADWANYLWSAVSPYLESFFGWLSSWFTDPNKRQQLWSAITTTWNFITEWAMTIYNVVSPYLGSFFNWLLSWFTDPNKRQSLWNGIVATWNFISEWAKALAGWITPYLSGFWKWLVSWFVDPAKNAQLRESIGSSWTAIVEWGASLWGWLHPRLIELWTNIKTWIDENYPTFGSWIDAFTETSTKIKDDWLSKWPVLTEAFKDFSDTIKNEIPLIIQALSDLYTNIAGESETGIAGYFEQAIAFYMRYFSFIIKTARIASEMLNEMVETTKAAFNFDWSGYASNSMEFGGKLSELIGHIATMPQLGQGYARGGNVLRSGLALVGEKGPELVKLSAGDRVFDTGQSRGKLNSMAKESLGSTVNNTTNVTNQSSINNVLTTINRTLSNLVETTKNISNDWSSNFQSSTSNNWLSTKTANTDNNWLDNFIKNISSNKSTSLTTSVDNSDYSESSTDNITNNYTDLPTKSQRLDLYIHNESKVPIDRSTVQEIARALQRELNLQGNRVVFAS